MGKHLISVCLSRDQTRDLAYLNVTDNLSFCGGGERVTSLGEDLHEVVSEVASSKVQSKDGMGKRIT